MSPDLADMTYLLERKPNATDAELEQFSERVAICMYDGRLSEDRAREVALRGIADA